MIEIKLHLNSYKIYKTKKSYFNKILQKISIIFII